MVRVLVFRIRLTFDAEIGSSGADEFEGGRAVEGDYVFPLLVCGLWMMVLGLRLKWSVWSHALCITPSQV